MVLQDNRIIICLAVRMVICLTGQQDSYLSYRTIRYLFVLQNNRIVICLAGQQGQLFVLQDNRIVICLAEQQNSYLSCRTIGQFFVLQDNRIVICLTGYLFLLPEQQDTSSWLSHRLHIFSLQKYAMIQIIQNLSQNGKIQCEKLTAIFSIKSHFFMYMYIHYEFVPS